MSPGCGAKRRLKGWTKDANCTMGPNLVKVDRGFRQTGSKALKLVRESWSRTTSARPTVVCVSVPVRLEWVSPLLVPVFAA